MVDDDHDAADSLAMSLEACGYVVKTAYNGKEAVALTERHLPAAVVSDIEMPGMSGLDTAKAVRELPLFRKPGLVALTGANCPQMQLVALGAGFDRFLAKPVQLSVLLDFLQDC